MPDRALHLAAYDVACPRRLQAALDLVRAYATGGQKSVYECFLTPAEKGALLADMAALLDSRCDRFFLLRLDPRAQTVALGCAVPAVDPPFFYAG
ncbi:CRISPR-associated endonuclease Cas2 [Immundisolibacter sp.]|jgi:CRISPR-associated protein Cas2|uniref:CRISPR-associated endonuclease Cas2 n=1 Tax=Immundisolibacter sp. TaxID=1934948 RepID=UPI001986CE09|nr:CRISPR-associated endonuclease Cas2 [Immundisolibacter sp.]MBC7162682.1 CRISPR-associated endonuclease Cas2 [Immundisolibacter sp.]MEA3220484.1 CRISPR-associated endoribonuclease Cas2 [Immundisolibacter sp.]